MSASDSLITLLARCEQRRAEHVSAVATGFRSSVETLHQYNTACQSLFESLHSDHHREVFELLKQQGFFDK